MASFGNVSKVINADGIQKTKEFKDNPLSAITDATKIIKERKERKDEPKERKFLCDNHLCMAQTTVKLTCEQLKSRLYFEKYFKCSVCGIGRMYLVNEE